MGLAPSTAPRPHTVSRSTENAAPAPPRSHCVPELCSLLIGLRHGSTKYLQSKLVPSSWGCKQISVQPMNLWTPRYGFRFQPHLRSGAVYQRIRWVWLSLASLLMSQRWCCGPAEMVAMAQLHRTPLAYLHQQRCLFYGGLRLFCSVYTPSHSTQHTPAQRLPLGSHPQPSAWFGQPVPAQPCQLECRAGDHRDPMCRFLSVL